ncbi:MAG: hypothetical protein LBT01_05170 [Spirochaetaceae bacterium]|jgi:hypothetical protein|nr:hypothetical protein [Spirochaetaceae bacterium]
MSYYDPIVAEVRRTREKLLERYGGWEGYSKHLDEMRPYWEAQGWHYETEEEFAVRLARSEAAEKQESEECAARMAGCEAAAQAAE